MDDEQSKIRELNKVCGVCGDRALGYNFNAVSCESCKAFFRRNALKNKDFRCPFSENCEITPVTRRFCQKCRLDKCFSIGMKKECIMSDNDKVAKRKKIEENRVKKKGSPDEHRPAKMKRSTIEDIEHENVVESEISTVSSPPYYLLSNKKSIADEKEQDTARNMSPVVASVSSPFSPGETSSLGSSTLDEEKDFLINNNSKLESGCAIISKENSCPTTNGKKIILNASQVISESFDTNRNPVCDAIEPSNAENDPVSPELISKLVENPEIIIKLIKNNPNLISKIFEDKSVLTRVIMNPQLSSLLINDPQAEKLVNNHGNSNVSHKSTTNDVFDTNQCSSENPILTDLITSDKKTSNNLKFTKNAIETNDNSIKNTDISIDIFEDVQRIPGPVNSIESILSKAIKLEFSACSTLGNQNSRELNDSERAKLNELIVANKALHAPLDDDITSFVSDDSRFKEYSGQSDPMLLDVINLTAIAIRRIIKMSKKINAFKNMCQEDQVALLKGGCTEIMILRSTLTYDHDKAIWNIPHSHERMSKIKVDILKEAKGNVYAEHARFVRTFDPKWRDENIILILSAIALFTPDRPKVVHSDVIKLEQNSYYYLLRRYLESMYPGCEAKSMFLKLIHKISELYKLNNEVVEVYLNVNPSSVEPLLIEIFDLKI